MSTHCPVCYEEFQAPPSHQEARILQCDHILCASCIKSDLSDGCFYCPECSAEHVGEVVDDVSRLYSGTTEETAVSDYTDTESSGEGNLTHRSKDSDASGSATRPLSQRDPCQEVGCTNKSMSNAGGFCLVHSKSHRSAITAVDRMAKDMAETNLNLISLSGSRLLQNSVSKANTLMDSTPDELIERFKAQQRMSLGEAMELIDRAKDIMFREPNILQLDAPVVTVGDIHGQFYDLVNLLEEGGKPGPENVYLFLGDYVDRGSFSCEVMLTLLKLKVAYPDRIWLLRGNHECRTVSGHFGFKEECKIKYGVNVYYRFLLTFQTMPLAAVISTAYGDIFACHGGLSPLWKTLEDIQRINRFVEPEDDPALLDILWSDPIDEYDINEMNDKEYEDFVRIEFRPNPTRGCSHRFGYKAVKDFLDANDLVCIVRAHEVQEDGYKRHFDPSTMERRMKEILGHKHRAKELEKEAKKCLNSGAASESLTAITTTEGEISGSDDSLDKDGSPKSAPKSEDLHTLSEVTLESGSPGFEPPQFATYTEDFPPVITIFSAPNYCDRYQNKAAILRIDLALDEFRVIQYSCVEHPVPEVAESQMDNHFLAIINTCPYMPTSLSNFVRLAVELGPESSWTMASKSGSSEDPQALASEEKADQRDGESEKAPVKEDSIQCPSDAVPSVTASPRDVDTCSPKTGGLSSTAHLFGSITESSAPDRPLAATTGSIMGVGAPIDEDKNSPNWRDTFLSPKTKSSIPVPKARKVSVSISLVRPLFEGSFYGMGMGMGKEGETSPIPNRSQNAPSSPRSPPSSITPARFGSKVGKKEPADPAYIPAALEGIDENDDGSTQHFSPTNALHSSLQAKLTQKAFESFTIGDIYSSSSSDNNEIRTMGELQSVEARTGRCPDKGAFSQYRGPSPGGSQFNRRNVVGMRSDVSVYFQAWASDSINEVHPERLTGFLPTHTSKKPFSEEERLSGCSSRSDEQMDEFSSFLRLKESELEEAIISVADLKKQFVRDSQKRKGSLKAPRAKTPSTRTTPASRSKPGSPMSANIAALSKRFSNYTVPVALPGQESSTDRKGYRNLILASPARRSIPILKLFDDQTGVKVVDYIPQPEPHEVQSEDSDSNVDSDVGSCSKPASTTVEKELSEKEKEKMLKLKLPLKINTESFYGDSTPNCAPQTSPMPPSPKLPRVLDPSPVSLSDKPNSVGKTSESLPPVSTESASPSAVSNIWKAAKLSKDAVTSSNTNSSNGAVESDRKSITDKGVKTAVSAVNGESNGSVGDSSSKDGSGSNGKGYRHRPDPLWRSVHSDDDSAQSASVASLSPNVRSSRGSTGAKLERKNSGSNMKYDRKNSGTKSKSRQTSPIPLPSNVSPTRHRSPHKSASVYSYFPLPLSLTLKTPESGPLSDRRNSMTPDGRRTSRTKIPSPTFGPRAKKKKSITGLYEIKSIPNSPLPSTSKSLPHAATPRRAYSFMSIFSPFAGFNSLQTYFSPLSSSPSLTLSPVKLPTGALNDALAALEMQQSGKDRDSGKEKSSLPESQVEESRVDFEKDLTTAFHHESGEEDETDNKSEVEESFGEVKTSIEQVKASTGNIIVKRPSIIRQGSKDDCNYVRKSLSFARDGRREEDADEVYEAEGEGEEFVSDESDNNNRVEAGESEDDEKDSVTSQDTEDMVGVVGQTEEQIYPNILFTQTEILGLRLMFSLFDRSGKNTIGYEDMVAYAEETGDLTAIRDAGPALEILDIDGDGVIGLLDFIHFAARLKAIHQRTHSQEEV